MRKRLLIIFILLNMYLWQFISNNWFCIVFRHHVPVAFYILFHLNSLFLVVNSSVNFIIYCVIGKDFRKKVIELFKCTGDRNLNIGHNNATITKSTRVWFFIWPLKCRPHISLGHKTSNLFLLFFTFQWMPWDWWSDHIFICKHFVKNIEYKC